VNSPPGFSWSGKPWGAVPEREVASQKRTHEIIEVLGMPTGSNNGLHVAIIMDGNGRWATRRGLPRVAGHRAGVASVREVIEHAPEFGIRRLTLYAFSSDNWTRPASEVQSIFWLMRAYLRLEADRLRQRGVQLKAIGRRDRIPTPLLREIEKTELATAAGSLLTVRVAVDYSSREAIARTVAAVKNTVSGNVAEAPDFFRTVLTKVLSAENSNVDLLIRTGGEKRLSDFLLWESAYAELHFTDRMWPDFGGLDLEAAIGEFNRRQRRFGGLPEPAGRATIAAEEGSR
jgi:undecaprenyl diphosphate synthase